MVNKTTINLQNKIIVDNATQRTIAILGGKGAGKTTLIKMFMGITSPVLVFDPLNVIKGDYLKGHRFLLSVRDIDYERIKTLMKVVNELLRKNTNVVLSFSNMVQSEEIELVNMIIPMLNMKSGMVFVDEIHEFVPIHSQSLEMERFCRHCRNKNIGFLMTSQRAAAVNKNTLALTDYLIVMRSTWTHDVKAIEDLLQIMMTKEEVKTIVSDLPKLNFLEAYTVDYRENESKNLNSNNDNKETTKNGNKNKDSEPTD